MFQSSHYQEVFAQHQLADFEAIWARKIDWFEAPNERRGGWSGVGTIALQANNHEPLSLFVKKQQNHHRFSLRNPIKGEPTFRREFEQLTFLAKRDFNAPRVVYYAEDAATSRAILITLELTGFMPLDALTHQIITQKTMSAQKKRVLLASVASQLRCFHQLNRMHRALYPKHIFVAKADTNPQIALIDLEKARFSPIFWNNAYFDLAALNRHAKHWRRTECMAFLKFYLQTEKLSFLQKLLCRLILWRAGR